MPEELPEDTTIAMMILAGAVVLGGILVGVALRYLLGKLARRDLRDADRTWGQFGWSLLARTIAPLSAVGGVWAALELLDVRDPARSVINRALVVIVTIAVVLAAARVAASVVGAVANARSGGAVPTESGAAQSASIIVNITRVVVVIIGLLVLLQSLGVSIAPMLTALGVGGLAVALALQDTLANLFAGVQIIASKKVKQGDFIRLDTGEEGYVVDVNWRNASVRQLAGNIIVIPNSRLADAVLTNFHQPMQDMSVVVPVGVGYDSDLEHVERVTVEVGREVMRSVEGAVVDHEPFIRFHTFGDSAIQFNVILRASEFRAQFMIVHEFIKKLHRRYQFEGITIPFPIRTLVAPEPPAASNGGSAGESGKADEQPGLNRVFAIPGARDGDHR